MDSKPRILLDLNIVLDVLANRQPHYTDSARTWAVVESGRAEGWLAAHSITTLFYLLARHTNRQRAIQAIHDVLQVFSVAAVDQSVIRRALTLGWRDFEDAVQMAAAVQAGVDYVITWNTKDFKGGPLPAIRPGEFLALLTAWP